MDKIKFFSLLPIFMCYNNPGMIENFPRRSTPSVLSCQLRRGIIYRRA